MTIYLTDVQMECERCRQWRPLTALYWKRSEHGQWPKVCRLCLYQERLNHSVPNGSEVTA